MGVSRHSRLRRLFTGSTGDRIASLAGSIDVHLVTHEQVAGKAHVRIPLSPLSRRRQQLGWLAALVLPAGLTLVLNQLDDNQLPLAVQLFLAVAVLVALIGGMLPALVAAVSGFLLLNWFFTPPVGRWTIAEPANVLALLVYVAVAAGVATVVDRASRRASEAARARAEAATLSSLSQSVLTGQDTAEAIVERLRETFAQDAVALLARSGTRWVVLATSGTDPATAPDKADSSVQVDADHMLALRGQPLRATDQRVLEGFAIQTGLVLEYRRLRERENRAAALERADATSTAILRAVSHDLRTPLATMRAAVDGLVSGDPALDEADRRTLVEAVDSSTDQLEHLIDNLLDLSRIQTGLLHPVLRPRSLEEILPIAVAGHPPGSVVLELEESAPFVRTDAGLLERVVANLVANAVRASRGKPVRVVAQVLDKEISILVIDRGPGVPVAQRDRMFEPFQRLDDTGSAGLGLGLAVARGLTEAMGGTLTAEDTPGGGLTMVLSVPREAPEGEGA